MRAEQPWITERDGTGLPVPGAILGRGERATITRECSTELAPREITRKYQPSFCFRTVLFSFSSDSDSNQSSITRLFLFLKICG